MTERVDTLFYRSALAKAKCRDLSGAVRAAGLALLAHRDHDSARKLRGLCLYELGDYAGAAGMLSGFPELYGEAVSTGELVAEAMNGVKELCGSGRWSDAESVAGRIPHQSVRTLQIRGVLCALAKRNRKAAEHFAGALEMDWGNSKTMSYMAEVSRRRVSFSDLRDLLWRTR
jgi:hypothetical protein